MATKVEIWNLALSHLGIDKEISGEMEKSSEARACRRFDRTARRSTLRDFEWPFATKFVVLGLIEKNPTSEWAFSYQYPSDCLHFRRILSGVRNDTRQSRIPYKLVSGDSGQEIYSDEESAQAEYTVDVEDTSRFPDDVVLAISYRLAAYMAPRLTGGDPYKLGDKAAQNYSYELSKAKATAVNEEQEEEDPDSEFIRARN